MSQPSDMKNMRLSDESLAKSPDEVFDIICKIGRGSYGSVFKAMHKEWGQVLAIKQVPVDTDLQEIIKEISIMQQCDSPFIVKYYGSYFKNTDLWIVMEYCGAGSVSDIMRIRNKTAIFMIPTKPPPSFRNPDKWSTEFIDFVNLCLVKNPDQRITAEELLQHEFILNAKPVSVLQRMIQEAKECQESHAALMLNGDDSGDEDETDGTMVQMKEDQDAGTMKAQDMNNEGTLVASTSGTVIISSENSTLEESLGTMVINEDPDEDTMKRHDTGTGEKKYRPAYLDHFEKKEEEHNSQKVGQSKGPPPHQQQQQQPVQQRQVTPPHHFQRAFIDGDFEFLKNLGYDELESRLAGLDPEMEQEIEELRARYQAKRQPILDAIDAKKKRQQNF
ncbi:serine/threonine-protein kinase 3-like [Liolophura sinensis]|uniref:serine/threonine-protein kinase 3-like n=1 Tax=Liolophura sinensis TaxID=3198878 RepID=UPI0031591E29